MHRNNIAALRIPAFLIDFAVVMLGLVSGIKLALMLDLYATPLPPALIFALIPLGFWLYWLTNINLGKRLFKLEVVDATNAKQPTALQWFKRSLLLGLVVPFNLGFLLPLFMTKRNQSFHDLLANTVVQRKPTAKSTQDAT